MSDRNRQRRALRQQRRAMDPHERRSRSEQLCRRVWQQPLFRNSQTIAAYLAADGEVETTALIERAWQLGKRVYLPVLAPFSDNRLWFARYTPDSQLVLNRFGIAEPRAHYSRLLDRQALDMVLTPLVGFDRRGNRLGMGGGFYDRSFAYLLRRKHWHKPRLVGLAFDFQCLDRLPARAWDVPLNAVATESRWYRF
jgi:5-formyltetrahydrofolate cyclo-ligase